MGPTAKRCGFAVTAPIPRPARGILLIIAGQNLPTGGGVGPRERDTSASAAKLRRKNPASRPVERGRLNPFSITIGIFQKTF